VDFFAGTIFSSIFAGHLDFVNFKDILDLLFSRFLRIRENPALSEPFTSEQCLRILYTVLRYF